MNLFVAQVGCHEAHAQGMWKVVCEMRVFRCSASDDYPGLVGEGRAPCL